MEQSFRIYVADALWLSANNEMWSERYSKLLENMDSHKTDNRTGDEIALDIITSCGLSFESQKE